MFDVQLGDGALVLGALFLRLLVAAARTCSSQRRAPWNGVPQDVLTRADLQLRVDETALLLSCGSSLFPCAALH